MNRFGRTWLFVPGADEAAHEAAAHCGADVLIQELEDSPRPRCVLLPVSSRAHSMLAGERPAQLRLSASIRSARAAATISQQCLWAGRM
jgi:citrate lyase beta subunit